MVCIAAFILLCALSVFVGVLSIFYRPVGKKYWKTFKKAWGCVWKKVRLQKCETGFKDDIKNSILAKVVVKKPKLVKPISIGIEITAVLIVFVTVWSLATAAKSGLALFVYGTCNVSQPSSCSLDASEACTIDSNKEFGFFGSIGNWFVEFGEVVMAVPTRLKHWDATQYLPDNYSYYKRTEGNPVALDILDPGCLVCRESFKRQLESGFFDRYNVALLLYPISDDEAESGYKFQNSYVIVRYLEAVRGYKGDGSTEWRMIERIFVESDERGRQYQDAFNGTYGQDEAERRLKDWLREWGYEEKDIEAIAKLAASDHVADVIAKTKETVENEIKTKKIPTIIYDGRRHDGLFEAK